MKDRCTTILAIVGLISMAFGTYFWFENRYALAEELKQLKQTVQYEFKSQQVYKTTERIWALEDRCAKKPPDEAACKELKRLQMEKVQYEMELKELGKGKK